MSARALWLEIGAVLGLWGLAVWLVGPGGDFPVNDDWSFARTVWEWLEHGMFRPLDWTSMPLLTHAAWGGLFAGLFGTGFDVLRASVLVAGALGLVALLVALADLGVAAGTRLLAVVSVGLSPLWFGLSFGFMTDIPFAALMAGSAVFYLRFLNTRSVPALALATALSVAAILSRQLGLALPLGVFLALLILRRRGWMDAVLGAASLAICVWVYLGFNGWLDGTGRTPALYDARGLDLGLVLAAPLGFVRQALMTVLALLVCLGVMVLPAGLALRGGGRQSVAVAAAVFVLGAVGVALLHRQPMPLVGNTFEPWGLGPRVLADTAQLGLSNLPVWPWPVWWGLTGAGLAGMALMLARVVTARWRRDARTDVALAMGLSVAIYLAAIASGTLVFDRYVIALAPLCVLMLAALGPQGARAPWRRGAAVALAVGLAALSIAGMREQMDWHRAVWRAITHAEGLGIGPDRMDAGFAYHGLRGYDPGYRPAEGLSWWWVRDDAWMVASGPVPGYAVRAEFPWRSRLVPGDRAVLLLERID